MNRRILLIASLAMLSGCAAPRPPILAPAGAPFAELEPLFEARAEREGLTIAVASHGCTSKQDFAVFVERQGQAARLAFGRRQLDRCRAAMRPQILVFTYEELGVARDEPIFLLNPLVSWETPG